jgi:ABC-type multidrug transport system fused ATPase/permease subunit
VLDGGRVAEFAPPKELVARGEGHFFDLMREGGLLEEDA